MTPPAGMYPLSAAGQPKKMIQRPVLLRVIQQRIALGEARSLHVPDRVHPLQIGPPRKNMRLGHAWTQRMLRIVECRRA